MRCYFCGDTAFDSKEEYVEDFQVLNPFGDRNIFTAAAAIRLCTRHKLEFLAKHLDLLMIYISRLCTLDARIERFVGVEAHGQIGIHDLINERGRVIAELLKAFEGWVTEARGE